MKKKLLLVCSCALLLGGIVAAGVGAGSFYASVKASEEGEAQSYAISVVKNEAVEVVVAESAKAGSIVRFTVSYDDTKIKSIDEITVNGNAVGQDASGYFFKMPEGEAKITVVSTEIKTLYYVTGNIAVGHIYGLPEQAAAGDEVSFQIAYEQGSGYTWNDVTVWANVIDGDSVKVEFAKSEDEVFTFTMPSNDVEIVVGEEKRDYYASVLDYTNVTSMSYKNGDADSTLRDSYVPFDSEVTVVLKEGNELLPTGIDVYADSEKSKLLFHVDASSDDATKCIFHAPASDFYVQPVGTENIKTLAAVSDEHVKIEGFYSDSEMTTAVTTAKGGDKIYVKISNPDATLYGIKSLNWSIFNGETEVEGPSEYSRKISFSSEPINFTMPSSGSYRYTELKVTLEESSPLVATIENGDHINVTFYRYTGSSYGSTAAGQLTAENAMAEGTYLPGNYVFFTAAFDDYATEQGWSFASTVCNYKTSSTATYSSYGASSVSNSTLGAKVYYFSTATTSDAIAIKFNVIKPHTIAMASSDHYDIAAYGSSSMTAGSEITAQKNGSYVYLKPTIKEGFSTDVWGIDKINVTYTESGEAKTISPSYSSYYGYYSFSMPDADDVSVTIVEKTVQSFTITNTEHLTITVYSDSACTTPITSAMPGATLYANAVSSTDDYAVNSITLTSGGETKSFNKSTSGSYYSIVMPNASDVVISATEKSMTAFKDYEFVGNYFGAGEIYGTYKNSDSVSVSASNNPSITADGTLSKGSSVVTTIESAENGLATLANGGNLSYGDGWVLWGYTSSYIMANGYCYSSDSGMADVYVGFKQTDAYSVSSSMKFKEQTASSSTAGFGRYLAVQAVYDGTVVSSMLLDVENRAFYTGVTFEMDEGKTFTDGYYTVKKGDTVIGTVSNRSFTKAAE